MVGDPIIELVDVSRSYQLGPTTVRALAGCTLSISRGEFVAVMGPSGSGKSTFLHILGLLDRPNGGSYRLEGEDVGGLSDNRLAYLRNRRMGFVFQQFHLLPINTALENAELPLIYAGRSSCRSEALARIREVGLAGRAGHLPNELSGGERQRVAIARSLVNDPAIIFADEPTGNLDSVSGEEIISLLESLNRRGKTVIMVTHEERLAGRAGRVIRMRDGEVVSDRRREGKPAAPGAVWPEPPPAESCPVSHSGRAVLKDHLRESLRAVFSHRLRSFLSMLGILIGVGAVIAMLALGAGAKEAIERDLARLGSNLLMVRPGSRTVRGVRMETGSVTRFTLQDAEAMGKLPDIRRVSPSVSGRGQLVRGNRNWNTRLQGVGVDYPDMRSAEPVEGRFFTGDELRRRDRVAVLGATVVRELFGEAGPVGAEIRINRQNFRVVGVLPEKGSHTWRDLDDEVLIPITTAMYRVMGKDYVDSIDVEVAAAGRMEAAEEELRQLIIQRHRLGPDREDSFQIRNMAEIQETIQSTTRTMSMLLGSIAAISLLVGGIGIMNIMLVSVTERTREIGIRKAVGASRKDILVQFLIEAVVMTLSGGLAGVLLGAGISWLLSSLAGWTVRVTPFSVILAGAFSVLVGLVFGLWPARQAARLSPIEALRYE
ncbi:MAG: ABC transporter permease [Candidatus Erginobacter occultus]|nr:ABC transporter permease [Candidatus Erginobacter occultus]